MKVTLIDQEPNPGGVCLYRGCIPSKALLHVAKVLTEAREAASMGHDVRRADRSISTRCAPGKNSVVQKLTGGLGQLRKQRQDRVHPGPRAVYRPAHADGDRKNDGSEQTLAFETAILATGSRPAAIPGLPSSPRIWDSTGALDLESIPGSAARRRRRLHRPGTGLRVRRAGHEGDGRRDDARACCPAPTATWSRPLAKRLEKRFAGILLNTKVAEIKEDGRRRARPVRGHGRQGAGAGIRPRCWSPSAASRTPATWAWKQPA